MTVEQALSFVDTLLQPESINHVQELVFRGAWEEQVYEEMATESGYDADYLRDVGSKLWKSLSQALGEKVTKNNFRSVLRRRVEEKPSLLSTNVCSTSLTNSLNWNVAIDPSDTWGRESELAILEQWIEEENCHLLAVMGMAGIGKSSLVAKLTERVRDRFDFVVWRSLRNAPLVEQFFRDLIPLLSPSQHPDIPPIIDCTIAEIIQCLRTSRCLIILDNFESVLQSGDSKGSYRESSEGYGQFLRIVGETNHQSSLIITSREKPKGLAFKEGKTLPVRSLHLEGLPSEVIGEIFASKNLYLTDQEIRLLAYLYAENPLLLKIAATTIQDLFNGEALEFLAQNTLVVGEIVDILEQQFNRLSKVEKQVMYCLGVKQNCVTFGELIKDVSSEITPQELMEVLQSLQWRSLIQKRGASFIQAPVIKEFVSKYNSNSLTKLMTLTINKPQLQAREALHF